MVVFSDLGWIQLRVRSPAVFNPYLTSLQLCFLFREGEKYNITQTFWISFIGLTISVHATPGHFAPERKACQALSAWLPLLTYDWSVARPGRDNFLSPALELPLTNHVLLVLTHDWSVAVLGRDLVRDRWLCGSFKYGKMLLSPDKVKFNGGV